MTGGLDITGVKELAVIASNTPRYIVAKTKLNQFKDMTSIHLLLIQESLGRRCTSENSRSGSPADDVKLAGKFLLS